MMNTGDLSKKFIKRPTGPGIGNGRVKNLMDNKNKKRILVMDDDPLMLDMLSKMTSLLGYDVTSAKDGQEAVVLYRKAIASGQRIHAVIMDLTIKNGMDGGESFKQLRKIDPEVVGVASSGQLDNPMISSYSNYGFKGALGKPFTMGALRELLNSLFN